MNRCFISLCFIPVFCTLLIACQPQPKKQPVIIPNNPAINLELGKLFLANNKLKKGVHVLPSGLQFSITQAGAGTPPGLNDLVTVYYQGQFIDGTVFDSNHAQNNPVTFRVSSVIKGWQQALMLMQPGAVWVLYIPPDLAYGEKGIPNLIGPNQTLIYSVHLLAIKK